MITFLGTIIFAVIIGIGSLDGRSGLALLGKYRPRGRWVVARGRARPTGVERCRRRAGRAIRHATGQLLRSASSSAQPSCRRRRERPSRGSILANQQAVTAGTPRRGGSLGDGLPHRQLQCLPVDASRRTLAVPRGRRRCSRAPSRRSPPRRTHRRRVPSRRRSTPPPCGRVPVPSSRTATRWSRATREGRVSSRRWAPASVDASGTVRCIRVGLQDPGRERVRPRQHKAGQRPAARVRERGGEHLDHRIRLDGRLGQVHDHPPAVEQLRTQRAPECRVSERRAENAADGEDHMIVPVALRARLAAALGGPAVREPSADASRIISTPVPHAAASAVFLSDSLSGPARLHVSWCEDRDEVELLLDDPPCHVADLEIAAAGEAA